ncbi:MAG: hypothetical protein WAW02_03915 [Sideroxyarcus sp.]
MERVYRTLQIMALVVALVAPPLFLVGYAYDWGFLDSFAIEHQMFIRAPQEYLGIALIVIFLGVVDAFVALGVHITAVVIAIVMIAVFAFTLRFWLWQPKQRSRFYLRFSNMRERITRKLNLRLVESVASVYLFSALPVLIFTVIVYLVVLIFSPGLIGYKKGQEAAKKFRDDWKAETCAPKTTMADCTQVLEGSKVIAAGKLIVASEKHAAIFDGNSVNIYSLNNRDIKTTLSELQKTSK